jgi:uncharacterized glyoxalase superfamily protein PhnB
MKATAVLYVPNAGEALAFWVSRMGAEVTVEVPHGEETGFAILSLGGAEIMLQSYASAAEDAPAFAAFAQESRAALFVEVEDFEDVARRLCGYEIALPQRDTFYRMREIGVYAPGGHLVVFGARLAG